MDARLFRVSFSGFQALFCQKLLFLILQVAADSAVDTGSAEGGGGKAMGGKGKAIMRLVAAAKQQQALEEQAEQVAAVPLLEKLKPLKAQDGMATVAEESSEQAEGRAGGGALVASSEAPVASAEATANEPSASSSTRPIPTFSRFDPTAASEPGGAWQPTDRKLHKMYTQTIAQAESRLEVELGIPKGQVSTVPPKPTSVGTDKEGGPPKGSVACAIL